jgi:hypothetical protein
MILNSRKLPIGIQDFEKLRTEGFVYVDKTEYLYQLASVNRPYFLGRPRRFGKSLFLSTLKAFFLGKKNLFEGLAVAEAEKDWLEYPVFHIDYNVGIITNGVSLKKRLNVVLANFENQWGHTIDDDDPATRFEAVIRQACIKSGRKVVVLIDEYDKPLVSTMDDVEINSDIRKILKSFYGVLKSTDEYLRFVMLTGVTKFSKVSVFSDLNHLTDISMDREYAGICGISETELVQYFQPEIKNLSKELELTCEETLAELKKHYDGYRFSMKGEDMYNPFSLLNTFQKKYFKNYWYETGTPTFLVRMLKDMDFDVKTLETGVNISANAITDYQTGDRNPIPLLYQSGYLTIKSYDKRLDKYVLGYPSEEVKYGFLTNLLPMYMPKKDTLSEFYVGNFIEDLLANNVEGFMNRLKAFFAGISYELNNKEEKHYQTVFYLLFRLMGQFIEAEQRSATGRADAVVTTDDAVYVFEFKLAVNATAEDALKQIDEKGYLIPFTAGNKRLVKIGAEFSAEERGLSRWVVAEAI